MYPVAWRGPVFRSSVCFGRGSPEFLYKIVAITSHRLWKCKIFVLDFFEKEKGWGEFVGLLSGSIESVFHSFSSNGIQDL